MEINIDFEKMGTIVKSIRSFGLKVGIMVITAAILFASCKTKKRELAKPNIIYILADDLGYGDLSFTGQEKFSTPNIDKLAKEGMFFTQHYAGSTVCAPSRSSLLTGHSAC